MYISSGLPYPTKLKVPITAKINYLFKKYIGTGKNRYPLPYSITHRPALFKKTSKNQNKNARVHEIRIKVAEGHIAII